MEIPSLERSIGKMDRSRDPNLLSLISSVSGVTRISQQFDMTLYSFMRDRTHSYHVVPRDVVMFDMNILCVT